METGACEYGYTSISLSSFSSSLRFPADYRPIVTAENSWWKDQNNLAACPPMAWSGIHHELWQHRGRDRDDWSEMPRWPEGMLQCHVPSLAQWVWSKTLLMGHAHWATRGLRAGSTSWRDSICTVSNSDKLSHTCVHTYNASFTFTKLILRSCFCVITMHHNCLNMCTELCIYLGLKIHHIPFRVLVVQSPFW